jgi:monoamine oxidase
MRRLPEMAPSFIENSRQSRKKPRQARGKLDSRAKRTKTAAMPEAAPMRSRLRATCPFSRAFWRRRGVACSVWLASAINQLSVLSCQFSVFGSQ